MSKYFICAFFFFLSLLYAQEMIQTSEDKERLAFFHTLSASTDHPHSIPKTFHCIWLGSAPFPQESIRNISEWKYLHPYWQFCFWTDVENSQAPIPGMEVRQVADFSFQFLEQPFSLSENLGERAKILAYEILYQEGGVYIDHDCIPCKPLDALNEGRSFYCGLESLGPSILSSSVYPATHLIATRSKQDTLKKAMSWLKANWEQLEEKYPGTSELATLNRITHRTLWALSEGIESTTDSVTVFPPHFFSNLHANEASYVTHKHAASWYTSPSLTKKEENVLQKLIEKEEKNISLLLSLGLVGLAIGSLSFFGWRKKVLILFLLISGLHANEFEEFMGKGTHHWKSLTEKRDFQLLEKCKKLYEQTPTFHKEKLIPPTIHFIWLGPRPFPPHSVENVRTWVANHPTWKVKFWTDRLRDSPCKDMEIINVKDFPFQFLKARYEETQNWGEKSDILRFEILYREGGVYVDHDANCLQSFEPFHHLYDFYAGLEAPHPPVMRRCLTAGNGVIGACPEHPAIRRALHLIDQRWNAIHKKYRGNDGFSRTQRVMERTYIILTEVLEEELSPPSIVFPAAHFFSKGGLPALYSKHFYANSWATNEEFALKPEKSLKRAIAKLMRRSELLTFLGISLLLANCLVFVALFFYYRKSSI